MLLLPRALMGRAAGTREHAFPGRARAPALDSGLRGAPRAMSQRGRVGAGGVSSRFPECVKGKGASEGAGGGEWLRASVEKGASLGLPWKAVSILQSGKPGLHPSCLIKSSGLRVPPSLPET